MSLAEKWQWHAEYYAFRRVFLGIDDDVVVSPADEKGVWYDERLVAEATRRLREKERRRRLARDAAGEEMRREGVAMLNKWARSIGFADFTAAEEAGHKHNDAIQWVIAKAAEEARVKNPPTWRGTAADLGVTAREFKPSPEQMAAARKELGIDDSEARDGA